MRILSFGGGVNSTAIIALALLGEMEMPDYIVFSDTGAEWPHTYQYLDYIEKEGIRITYLTGGNKGMTMIEWCQFKNYIPCRMNRWCTDYWKRAPLDKFAKAFPGSEQLIGIDAGEERRAKNKKKSLRYPLIEMGINRQECKQVILRAGLGVPKKSGCFICPYQRKGQWIELKKKHPELWRIAVDLEKGTVSDKGIFTYKNGLTIEEFVADLDRQEELPFGAVLDQKCECYFD